MVASRNGGERRVTPSANPPYRATGRRPAAQRYSTRRRRRRVRRSREGALASWPDVRVKPGAPPMRWPRASTRPRWPVDAKTPFKEMRMFFSTRCDAGAAGWAGVPIAGAPGATRVQAPGPPWKRLNAAKTASARKKSKLRNPLNPAVQAGFRRTASRRAEPLPTLSHEKQTPARSDNADNSDSDRDSDNSYNSLNSGSTDQTGSTQQP